MNQQLPLISFELPSQTLRVFTPLCATLTPAQASQLRVDLHAYRAKIAMALQQNEFLDTSLANNMCDKLDALLAEYDTFSVDHRPFIVGAARYFIRSDDGEHDFDSLFGFEDDLQVLNVVLKTIGQSPLQ